jgi:hypothetical protein
MERQLQNLQSEIDDMKAKQQREKDREDAG